MPTHNGRLTPELEPQICRTFAERYVLAQPRQWSEARVVVKKDIAEKESGSQNTAEPASGYLEHLVRVFLKPFDPVLCFYRFEDA